MPLDHLWATWRSNYVTQVIDTRADDLADGRTLFERILAAGAGDDEKHIVTRGATCFVLLNKFPYTAGHLLVLPNRGEADLEGLTSQEHTELWATVTTAVVALKAAFRCDAVNVGLNLGHAAGGSQSDHLHVHCVPRWVGDANFIAVAGETRVLPVSLDEALVSLRAVWGGGVRPRSVCGVTDPTPDPVEAAEIVDDADIVDELPDDLDVTELSGDYLLPNNNRRRIPAAIYLVIAVACAVLWATERESSPLVNDGFLWVAILLGAFALYGLVAGRTLLVDETQALATATTTVGFPVGHASAQMVWRGWLSRPVWRLLAYSADNPPSRRAIVVVDGISGEVVEWFAETNPEEWAQTAS